MAKLENPGLKRWSLAGRASSLRERRSRRRRRPSSGTSAHSSRNPAISNWSVVRRCWPIDHEAGGHVRDRCLDLLKHDGTNEMRPCRLPCEPTLSEVAKIVPQRLPLVFTLPDIRPLVERHHMAALCVKEALDGDAVGSHWFSLPRRLIGIEERDCARRSNQTIGRLFPTRLCRGDTGAGFFLGTYCVEFE